MTDNYIDVALKLIGFVASVGGGAAAIAWWLGARLDKITTQLSRLELRMSQRLTRLETKIFNGDMRHIGHMAGDESHDD